MNACRVKHVLPISVLMLLKFLLQEANTSQSMILLNSSYSPLLYCCECLHEKTLGRLAASANCALSTTVLHCFILDPPLTAIANRQAKLKVNCLTNL